MLSRSIINTYCLVYILVSKIHPPWKKRRGFETIYIPYIINHTHTLSSIYAVLLTKSINNYDVAIRSRLYNNLVILPHFPELIYVMRSAVCHDHWPTAVCLILFSAHFLTCFFSSFGSASHHVTVYTRGQMRQLILILSHNIIGPVTITE